jgi:hypothetical protein
MINMPVNNSVMFVREGDVIVSSDLWKAVLSFEVTTYHDTVKGLKSDPICSQEISEQHCAIRRAAAN